MGCNSRTRVGTFLLYHMLELKRKTFRRNSRAYLQPHRRVDLERLLRAIGSNGLSGIACDDDTRWLIGATQSAMFKAVPGSTMLYVYEGAEYQFIASQT